MENESKLKQGQKIDAIFCPGTEEMPGCGGAVGYDRVTEIEISQCRGPMGWYDAAIIKRRPSDQVEIIPVHMAEYIRLNKESE